MSFNPLVSIIINTHNGIEYLEEAIQSALAQTYSPFEIIVYDNASTVNVKGVVSTYGERVRYFRSDYLLTLGQARNEALKLAQGELIDYLDADDIFLPNKLATQVPFFQDPEIGIVCCRQNIYKKTAEAWVDQYPTLLPLPDGWIFKKLLQKNFIPWDSAIFRKAALGNDPTKWFNSQFNMCTDYDLFLRICHKYKFAYLHEVVSKWREHGENLSRKRAYLMATEQLQMLFQILEYEPDLFKKHPAETRGFIRYTFNILAECFWARNIRKYAFLSMLFAFFSQYKLLDFLKSILTLLIPLNKFRRLKNYLQR